MKTYLIAGTSRKRQSAAKLEREGSTTIENIAKKKYLSEEVSRVAKAKW